MISLKRTVCIVVSILLLLTYLAGCNANNSKKTETGKASDDEVVTGYPIVDKPLTLRYWVPMHVNATKHIRSFAENEAYQEMEKRTGITIDFTHPAQGQENEQFNLMIASGDLPDIITGGARYKGGEVKGIDDGVFLDLSPYMKKYAPDYINYV